MNSYAGSKHSIDQGTLEGMHGYAAPLCDLMTGTLYSYSGRLHCDSIHAATFKNAGIATGMSVEDNSQNDDVLIWGIISIMFHFEDKRAIINKSAIIHTLYCSTYTKREDCCSVCYWAKSQQNTLRKSY